MNIRLNISNFRARLLITMFCAGLYSLLAQILMLRELLVSFFGNELTLGAILGSWLIGISLGSLIIYRFTKHLSALRIQWLVAVLLGLLAFFLPVQIVIIRKLHAILHVPFGEYVSFSAMLSSTVVTMLPTSLMIGAIFPCACQLAQKQERHPVSRVYALDALGSMTGGVLFTFLLVHVMEPFSMAAFAGACAMLGSALMVTRPSFRKCLFLLALCFAAAAFCPKCLDGIERSSIEGRWRAFGCLPAKDKASSTKLLVSVDSRHQNLALIETEGQKTLYGNGQVMFVFPDQISGEHKINFIMAQNPEAESVLLIGGNPVTDVPELLKYPVKRLACVELDQDISRILYAEGGPEYRKAIQDPRVKQYHIDGPRFVKTCREMYDAVIVDAPSPTTVALNRFYTIEFYQDIQRILTRRGFMYTSIESSVQLQDETASLSASVYQSLKKVFCRVLATAGMRNQFFAGMADSPLTFNRETLFQRSAAAHLKNIYFRPEYFLNADEISPEKVVFVKNRLEKMRVPANTSLKPVSTFYYLTLWSRFSGSRLEPFLRRLRRISFDWTYATILVIGVVFLLIGGLLSIRQKHVHFATNCDCSRPTMARRSFPAKAAPLGRKHRGKRLPRLHFEIPKCPGIFRAWRRCMLAIAISTTGCCEMALEIILIFVFQNLFGYVYARIGLIIAMFMLGMMIGSVSAARMTEKNRAWPSMIGLELIILCVALAIPSLMIRFLHSSMTPVSVFFIEASIYGLVILVGWAGGAQFPVGNYIMRDTGSATGPTAALTNAADLFGGALGGFAIGVFLLPTFGISASCILLAAVKGASLLAVLSARLMKVL